MFITVFTKAWHIPIPSQIHSVSSSHAISWRTYLLWSLHHHLGLSFRFSHQIPVCNSTLPHACHMPRPSQYRSTLQYEICCYNLYYNISSTQTQCWHRLWFVYTLHLRSVVQRAWQITHASAPQRQRWRKKHLVGTSHHFSRPTHGLLHVFTHCLNFLD
jgi:hypothetical protein